MAILPQSRLPERKGSRAEFCLRHSVTSVFFLTTPGNDGSALS